MSEQDSRVRVSCNIGNDGAQLPGTAQTQQVSAAMGGRKDRGRKEKGVGLMQRYHRRSTPAHGSATISWCLTSPICTCARAGNETCCVCARACVHACVSACCKAPYSSSVKPDLHALT